MSYAYFIFSVTLKTEDQAKFQQYSASAHRAHCLSNCSIARPQTS